MSIYTEKGVGIKTYMKLGALLKMEVFNKSDCREGGGRGSFALRHFYQGQGSRELQKNYEIMLLLECPYVEFHMLKPGLDDN